jgi:hypothetical protein
MFAEHLDIHLTINEDVMKKSMKVAALVCVLSSVGLMVATSAGAMPKNGWERFYYSDASKTVEVGEATFTCKSTYTQSGVVTPYYREITWVCYTGIDG